jgi:FkbM family methyltransferase
MTRGYLNGLPLRCDPENKHMQLVELLGIRNIVLLGAGQLGRMALAMWPADLKRPTLILDAHRTGDLAGIPISNTTDHVVSDRNLYVLSYFKDSARNVLSLFSNMFHQEVFTIYDVLTAYLPDQFSNGWIGHAKDHSAAIQGASQFADSLSRAIYTASVDWRYHRHLSPDYPVQPESDKYTRRRYGMAHTAFDLVLDGGAYDLSLPHYLEEACCSWTQMVAIEPDPRRRSFLKDQINQTSPVLGRHPTQVDSRALWSSIGSQQFYGSGLLSSRIARAPTADCVSVTTTTLAQMLLQYGAKADDQILVKLHIEGAEWPVIESSLSAIAHYNRIHFFINLSHDEDSLTRLPAALAATGKFDLYLNSHSLFGEGITLFAKHKVMHHEL